MAKNKTSRGKMSRMLGIAARKHAAQSRTVEFGQEMSGQPQSRGTPPKTGRNAIDARASRKSMGRKPGG